MTNANTNAVVEARPRIWAAIEAAEAQGYRIKPGVLLIREQQRCCPLGAALVPLEGGGSLDNAGELLGLSGDDAIEFAHGFDGGLPPMGYDRTAFFELGQEFRGEVATTQEGRK